MMRWVIVALFLLSCVSVAADSKDLETAYVMYRQGHYLESAELFDQLLVEHPNNVPLLYNTATAFAQAKKRGHALRYFQQAQDLSPFDEDIRHNIAVVNRDVPGYQPPSGFGAWMIHVLSYISYNILTLFLMFLVSIGLVFWGRYLWRPIVPKPPYRLAYVLSLIVVGLLFTLKSWVLFGQHQAIIVRDKVAIKSGPSEALATVHFVHDGIRCDVLKRLDGWVKIRIGRIVGWVPEEGLHDV